MEIYKIVNGIGYESYKLLLEMSPYLLLGFTIAGILHVIMEGRNFGSYLSKKGFITNVKSAAFGVPLPLCSCGVIPVSAHLQKEGASKGAVVSFLVSTPTTGVDSILATYGLLGPLFAIIRALASFIGGIFAGTLIDAFDKENADDEKEVNTCPPETAIKSSISKKIFEMFRYAYIEMIADTAKWIIIGILAGGVIAYFIPESLFSSAVSNRFLSYLVMLVVGIPMYVCATGSIPIAASLIMKGMSYGAGLIFLIAGPATNTATMSFIAGKLGKKALFLYLMSIAGISIAAALILDYLHINHGLNIVMNHEHGVQGFSIADRIFSAVFAVLLALPFLKKIKRRGKMDMQIIVKDISCDHCKRTIESGLKEIDGVKSVYVDVQKKTVNIEGTPDRKKIIEVIEKLGYTVL